MKDNDTKNKDTLGKSIDFVEVVRRISEGNKTGLNIFYELYGKNIYTIAKTICPIQEDADTVVNDVLSKVWDSADVLPSITNPEAWIHRITENLAKDLLKRKKWFILTEDMNFDVDKFLHVNGSDDFNYYIDGLNEIEQNIVVLRFIKDMSFEDISASVDMPIGTITSTYYRALYKIKEKIRNSK